MDTTNNDEHDLAKALDSVAAELDAQKSGAPDDSSNKGYLFAEPVDAAPAPGTAPVILPGSPIAPPAGAAPVTPPSDAPAAASPVADEPKSDDIPAFLAEPDQPFAAPAAPQPTALAIDPDAPASTGNSELDAIKSDALQELRPLVDKLSVSPEEKFDTYLLLIRSTDDPALIGPAHEAAKLISDEARRAEALLDVIKEIDYLSKQQKAKE